MVGTVRRHSSAEVPKLQRSDIFVVTVLSFDFCKLQRSSMAGGSSSHAATLELATVLIGLEYYKHVAFRGWPLRGIGATSQQRRPPMRGMLQCLNFKLMQLPFIRSLDFF